MTGAYGKRCQCWQVCLFTLILVLLVNFSWAENNYIEVGKKAPDFTLPNLKGQDVNLQELISKEDHTLILIWGVWCPYCRGIMVDLKNSYLEYKKNGLELVGISIGESGFKVSLFIDQLQPGFPILLDEWAELREPYLLKDVPRVVLVDRQGIVCHTAITTSLEKIKTLLADFETH